MYVFQLFDFYGASGICLLFYCFFEALVIGWVYSKYFALFKNELKLNILKNSRKKTEADRLYDNIETMIGFQIIPWFRWCWKYCTPAVTAATLAFYIATHKSFK